MKMSMRLFQRKNGIWYAEFDRETRVSLKTRDEREARRIYERLKKAYLNRNLALLEGRPPKKLLGDFVEEFLEHSFQTKAKFTYQTDCQALRRAAAFFGQDTPLSSINRRSVDGWLAFLAGEIKPTSANTWFRHFKAAMSKAVAWGYLKQNPCLGVKQLKTQEGFPRFLTKEEVDRLLKAEVDSAFYRLWQFLLLTGCRRSEALAIQSRDINWDLRRIHIGQTKNRRPKAIIITPELAALLHELPQVGRLFPWKPDSVTHHFQRTARAAGLECRLHDLRHTYGSWLAMAGVNLQVIRDLMGHQDVKTTQIYAHLSQDHLEEAASRLTFADKTRTEPGKTP
jgi:integrase